MSGLPTFPLSTPLLPRTSSLDQTTLLITGASHSPCLPPDSRLQFPAGPQNYSNKPIIFSRGKWGYHTFLVLPTRIFGLPQSIEIDQRPDKKFSQGFIGASTATEGSKNKEQFPLLICSPRWGRAGSLHKVRVWAGPGAGLEGAHPFDGGERQGHAQCPAIAPDRPVLLLALQNWWLGFQSLCILLSRICPNCTFTQLFLVPYRFFVFCCWRRHLSRCKPCSRGSQVPACLTGTTKPAPTSRSLCSSAQPLGNSAGASSPGL